MESYIQCTNVDSFRSLNGVADIENTLGGADPDPWGLEHTEVGPDTNHINVIGIRYVNVT
jgi:hypothetical protein